MCTAATPGLHGTWPSSKIPGGGPAAATLQATAHRRSSSPRLAPSRCGWPTAATYTAAGAAGLRPGHGDYFAGTHRKPAWRKEGRHEGFRIVAVRPGHIRRLSRHTGEIWVPMVGWVRFRWSRPVPSAKSYRVTLDRAGRWHVAFAAIPQPIPGPGTGEVVGIDRGVVVSAALSTGDLLHCPGLRPAERERRRLLQRKLARARKGSHRRTRVKTAIAKLRAREIDRRQDWAENLSTNIARRFDVIRVEDLRITNMTRSARGTLTQPGRGVQQKAGLNRAILASGWACWSAAWTTRPPAGPKDLVPRSPASGARRVGMSQRTAARAKRCSAVPPADTPATLCERGRQHRRRACGDCAGTLATGRADEPRTSTSAPLRIEAEIPAINGGEDVKCILTACQ